MKDNFTRIAVILDRSGSMESCKESTVAGFNEFIRTQQELPGEATVKLVQFDDQYETVFDKPLKECPELTQNTFVPRGSTALLDAQGRTIVELGRNVIHTREDGEPWRDRIIGAHPEAERFTRGELVKVRRVHGTLHGRRTKVVHAGHLQDRKSVV